MDYIQCTKCGNRIESGEKHLCPIADHAVLGEVPPHRENVIDAVRKISDELSSMPEEDFQQLLIRHRDGKYALILKELLE